MQKSYIEKFGDVVRDWLLNNENPRFCAKAIAKVMNKHINYVYRLADVRGLTEQDHYNHFPLEHLAELTLATGDYRLLDFIEKECGRVGVMVPTIYNDSANIKLAAKVLKESAEAAEEWLNACEDGVITEREKLKVFQQADEAIKALAALWMSCKV